jgi:hypothetical protein
MKIIVPKDVIESHIEDVMNMTITEVVWRGGELDVQFSVDNDLEFESDQYIHIDDIYDSEPYQALQKFQNELIIERLNKVQRERNQLKQQLEERNRSVWSFFKR